MASLLAVVHKVAQKIARKIAQKRWFPGALLSAIALLCFVLEAAPFLSIERSYYAFLSSLKNTPSTGLVAVVGLDDYSRSVYGPTPRREVAQAIRTLSQMGAKTVALALEFPQEDNAPALGEFRLIANSIGEDEALMKIKAVRGIRLELEKAGKRVDADAALLKALKVRVKLVFPMYFGFDGKDGMTPPAFISKKALPAEPPVRWPGNIAADIGKFKNPLHLLKNPVPTAGSMEYPFDALSSKARAFGHINVLKDTDGIVRKHHLMIEYAGKLYPSLALRLALRHSGVYLSEYEGMFRDRGVEGMDFDMLKVPSDSDFGMLYGTTDLPPVYTLASLLRGTAPEGAFKGRAVILGDVSRYAKRYITHDGLLLTGAELHARAIMDMLSGTQVIRPTWAFPLELAVYVLFGIFVSIVLPRVHLKVGSLVLGLLIVALLGVSLGLYFVAGYWLMPAFASAFLFAGFAMEAVREYVSFGMREEVLAENIENNKMLGLSFQGQGMLDMALEKFMRCPVGDPSLKDLLYNLALDFERKRMSHKAKGVYEHILSAGPYKDAADRLAAITGTGGDRGTPAGTVSEGTVISESTGVYHTLGRYEVIEELGRGAMGTVYLGRDPKINRDVAIKTLLFENIDPDELESVKERFFKEAEASGRLSHPNIMTMFDAGEEHDLAFLAMEVLKGEDLKKYCLKENLLPHKEVIKIVADIADALAYAHLKGVVHRDIKPANIMRLEDGSVKVTDFGIARVVESSKTQTGTVLGTPSYMSPEQVEGKKVSGPSDLFSLGVMFYELLAGEKPFGGDSIATIMFNITRCKYTSVTGHSADIPKCCSDVIDGLLVKSVKKRYSDGAQVALDLRACLEDS